MLSFSDAVATSLNAGVDVIMTSGGMFGGQTLATQLDAVKRLVESGSIAMERLDDAVRRVVRVKHILGLRAGSHPSSASDPAAVADCVGCAAHRGLARRAAAQSAVLLINRNSCLPLDPTGTAPLIVTGKGAHNLGMQCGGWSLEWQGMKGNGWTAGGTTIWEAVKAEAPHAKLLDLNQAVAEVHFAAEDARAARHPIMGRSTRAVAEGPVAILVVGEEPYAEGGGDCASIGLDAEAAMDIERLKDHGARVVVLLLSGRPLAIPESALEKATAVVACWLPGTEGAGVTDVVFGRTAFSGKLSFAWPKGDHDASHARRHRNALFPLGYGLETPVTMQALSTAPALW